MEVLSHCQMRINVGILPGYCEHPLVDINASNLAIGIDLSAEVGNVHDPSSNSSDATYKRQGS
jgi:hypothetical protein